MCFLCEELSLRSFFFFFFFFNDTATTEIYTLSLHDALPIYAIFNVNSRDLLTRLSRISVVFVVVVLRHHSVARQDGLYGAILLLE